MKKKMMKKLIIIAAACIVALAALLLLLLPKSHSDPHRLLARAEKLSEQNLCLTAILKENPQDEESWRLLLRNYQILSADPLTLEATRSAAANALGHTLQAAEANPQPEEPGALIGAGGIIHDGFKLTDYSPANALAADGETVYLACADGIYADYHGLRIKINSTKAERMIAAENGLYYLNASARRVQYIARDGHRTQTLSEIPAIDFAFWNNALWIIDVNGALYRDDKKVSAPAPVSELCIAADILYAAGREGGLIKIAETESKLLLASPARCIAGDRSGYIFYIDANGYPARFDPQAGEAIILKEKSALAVGSSKGKPYYLNKKHQLKKCG